MVTRMISAPLFPNASAQKATDLVKSIAAAAAAQRWDVVADAMRVLASLGEEEPIVWTVGSPHPLIPSVNVMRMFRGDLDGVEVYSVSADGKDGIRDLVPSGTIRLVQEAMPIDVFVEMVTEAELGDEPDDPEPDPEPAPVPVANGQSAAS
jgi:hypothetical protein